jgi:hypothetical protein
MRGQPVMGTLTAYDHYDDHDAKINSHPVYATVRSGPEPGLMNEANSEMFPRARAAPPAASVL